MEVFDAVDLGKYNLVDVRSPLSNTVVATFHEKPDGFWVQRARSEQTVNTPIDLQTSVDAGQNLLDGLPDFKQRITGLASQAQRTPIGIEYLYHQHAQRLEQATRSIEQALSQKNLAQGDVALASTFGPNTLTRFKVWTDDVTPPLAAAA